MSAQTPCSQASIQQIAEQIFSSRRITRADQSLLMTLSCSCSFSEQEQSSINRIYALLHKGFIKVVD